MKEIVRVENLQKSFGKFKALHDVNLVVESGQVVGFIGPNGSGKTTTIRVLLGTIKRDSGTAMIFNRDVWDESIKIHEDIAYVPDDVSLWGNLTGGEIIDLFMKLHGKGDLKKSQYLIERFELDTKKKSKTYSKGNRQKVGLISALSVDAELYIFDEPTSGLDPLMERIFQEEVIKLKDQGKAILLSSHILSQVEHLADKIAIIREGRIIESGTLDELRHLTRSKVTISTDGDISKIKSIDGIHSFMESEKQVVFFAENTVINEVLITATELGIKKIEIMPPTLEDLFIRHYERGIGGDSYE